MSQNYPLTIDRLGAQGDGVAATSEGPVYIPFTAPGDEIAAELVKTQRGIQAVRWELKTPSPHRIEPPCSHFGTCGGCSLQHVDKQSYARFLQDKIAAALAQHDLNAEILPPRISPPGSRRRATLNARWQGDRLLLGFHRPRTHAVVDIEMCPVLHPDFLRLVTPLRRILADIVPPSHGATIALTRTDTGVDLRLNMADEPDLDARQTLSAFAEVQDLAAISWWTDGVEDPIAKRRPAQQHFGPARLDVSPGAFLQATAEGEAALVDAVTDALKSSARVADLFAGIGTFTFPLAQTMAVQAVEGSGAAIASLQSTIRRTSGIKPVTIHHRDLFRRPLLASELRKLDAVVIDPPRAGAKAQFTEIAQSDMARVVAASCNPATFARDAKLLTDAGFGLKPIQPVGQFLWSAHVELVAVFDR